MKKKRAASGGGDNEPESSSRRSQRVKKPKQEVEYTDEYLESEPKKKRPNCRRGAANQVTKEVVGADEEKQYTRCGGAVEINDKLVDVAAPAPAAPVRERMNPVVKARKAKPEDQEKIHIHVESVTGKLTTYEVKSSDIILKLKDKIRETEGIPPSQLRLIFSGRRLEPSRTFEDYNIKHQSTLQWMLCQCGC